MKRWLFRGPSGSHSITINGTQFAVSGDPSDEYLTHFVQTGCYTDDITAFMAARVSGDACCYDVGANIGLTAIFLTTLSPRVTVVAFEPAPSAARYLKDNLRRNGLDGRVRVESCALSNAVGQTSFMEMPAHLSGSYIAEHSAEHPNAAGLETVTVRTTTLDAYVEEHEVARIDLLKIDVEGHELAALEGAAASIKRLQPTTIIEFNLWAIVHLQRMDPDVFLEAVFDAFPLVGSLGRGSGVPAPLSNRPEARRAFIEGCAERGFVDNLVGEFRSG